LEEGKFYHIHNRRLSESAAVD